MKTLLYLLLVLTSPCLLYAQQADSLQLSKQTDTTAGRSQKLESVTVQASKPVIVRKPDRTVFNVESSITSVGSDAVEALKKAPGVQVTGNNIGMAGKSTVSVMLNDRLIQMSGDELIAFLRSIPADQIARIEVIATPPARYDAAGNAGIINIVMKKSMRNGLNGNLTAGYEQNTYGSISTNGALNYCQGNLNIFGNGNYDASRSHPVERASAPYMDGTWKQENSSINSNSYKRYQAGIDYNLNADMVIGLLYTYAKGGPNWGSDDRITARFFQRSNILDSLISTDAYSSEHGQRHVANLNYEWKLDTLGRKLLLDLDYFDRRGTRDRDLDITHLLPDGTPTGISSRDNTFGAQKVRLGAARLDIEWPTRLVKLNFGGKASFIHNVSDNVFRYWDGSDFIVDNSKTNVFDYKENTQALYLSAQQTIKKWSFQAGLRGEYTQTRGYSVTLGKTNTNDYLKLFPTAYIQYRPGEEHNISLNYSRRVNRPSFWSMNPFRSYTTLQSYYEGNPYLQPSFSNNIELNYVWKNKYTFQLFMNRVDHYSTDVSFVDTVNNTMYIRPENVGLSMNYGISFSGDINLTGWWESNMQVYGYYNKFRSSFYNAAFTFSQGRPSLFAFTTQSFTFNRAKTWLAEINVAYQAQQQSDFYVYSDWLNVSAAIKALFLEKRLIFTLGVNDLFRTDKTYMRNSYNGVVLDNYYDQRSVRLYATWKFGNKQIKDHRERNADNDVRRGGR